VAAESGIGTAAPALTAPATGTGSISFWNGVGYTTCTLYALSCPVTGGNYPIVPVVWTTVVDGHPLVVSMSAAITAGGKTTSSSCSGTCTHTSAAASSGAPLLGDITYQLSYDGSTVMNVNIHVDLGALIANTSYQVAPSG